MSDYEHDLLNTVAHDLKTPISAVKGFIELIAQAGPMNENQLRFADRALRGLDKMEHLVTGLLQISRLESGVETLDLAPCDLGKIIHDSAELLLGAAMHRDITLHINTGKGRVTVLGDAGLLAQVIDNLVSNAIKYNREGGEVWVTMREQSELVRVDVRDTGIGIPSEDLKRVFERFFRSKTEDKFEGSGLGLAIVQTVITRHGGRIWVESEIGNGSTFSFVLPKAPKHDKAARVDASGEQSDGVDDVMQDSAEKNRAREDRYHQD